MKTSLVALTHPCVRDISKSLYVVRPSEPASVGGVQRENERSECPILPGAPFILKPSFHELGFFMPKIYHEYKLIRVRG